MVGPLVAVAETTFPVSSSTTLTSTTPEVLIRFAASGYVGAGSDNAVPLSTPPETGFRIGRGAGTAAGGGSSTAIICLLLVSTVLLSTGPAVGSELILFDAPGRTVATVFLFAATLGCGLVSTGFVSAGLVTGVVGAATGWLAVAVAAAVRMELLIILPQRQSSTYSELIAD